MADSDRSSCTEGRRFDRLEQSLEGIRQTLATLTELLISKATTEIKVKALEDLTKDLSTRVRELEKVQDKGAWVERLAWVVLVACLLAYLKLQVS